ncbi:hypothetical protein [Streptomyces sp. NPDC006368]|uniref:hypothetical protein n=1 Tax=Streptomyces sp. NPDC006368 TaxID=3156760 RepID=UPI00339EAE81
MPDSEDPRDEDPKRRGDTKRREKRKRREEPAETDSERRRRRAQFLRELNEAKALRDRVQPRRARAARMRQAMRMRTFRW